MEQALAAWAMNTWWTSMVWALVAGILPTLAIDRTAPVAPADSDVKQDDPACPAKFGRAYVNGFGDLPEGASRQETLDSLICLAISEDAPMGVKAVGALVQLAYDPDTVRAGLHGILERRPAKLNDPVWDVTCGLLVYVADETSRALLRRLVVEGWETTGGQQYDALLQLADLPYADWLEETIAGLPSNDRRIPILANWVDSIHLRNDPDRMLATLRSEKTNGSRAAWVLREGIRYGIPIPELRAAARERIRKGRGFGRLHASAAILEEECERLGLFSLTGAKGNGNRIISCGPGRFPPWVTRPGELHSAFWREDRVQQAGGTIDEYRRHVPPLTVLSIVAVFAFLKRRRAKE